MPTAKEIADRYLIPVDEPWSQLSEADRSKVERAMKHYGCRSVNGPSGFHQNLRQNRRVRVGTMPIRVSDLDLH